MAGTQDATGIERTEDLMPAPERHEREPVRLQLMGGRANCTHHWDLEDPAEGWIAGRCRTCGGRKRFPASPDSTQRFDDYREITAASAYNERLTA